MSSFAPIEAGIPLGYYTPQACGPSQAFGPAQAARDMHWALSQAGMAPVPLSHFSPELDNPCPGSMEQRAAEGFAEADRVVDACFDLPRRRRPRLWMSYGVNAQAPDLLGPRVAAMLNIPYIVAITAPTHLGDHATKMVQPDSLYAEFAQAALALADVVLTETEQECDALSAFLSGFQTSAVQPPVVSSLTRPRSAQSGEAATSSSVSNRPWRIVVPCFDEHAAPYLELAKGLEALADIDWQLELLAPAEAALAALKPFGTRLRVTKAPSGASIFSPNADLAVFAAGVSAHSLIAAQAAGLPVIAPDIGPQTAFCYAGHHCRATNGAALGQALRAEWNVARASRQWQKRQQDAFEQISRRHAAPAAIDALRDRIEGLIEIQTPC
ncbi:MAG: hypothetical protein MRY63_03500 [Neomegalonema sp.]|nr:hypothetical protein [Neomegalonema sp.]